MKKSCNFALKLEVKSVTCPGVWLCLNGYVSLIVSTLGMEYETKQVSPIFPLNFHEVFYFKRNIDGVNNLSRLRVILNNEAISFLLVQWPANCSCDQGRVLSKFHGSLDQLLYPTSESCNNKNIELLMKPSSIFPGILAPKIEIITITKIMETLERVVNSPINIQKHVKHVNMSFTSKFPKRQHAVCHSHNYHRKFYKNETKNQFDSNERKLLCGNSSMGNVSKNKNQYLINNKVLKIHQLSNCEVCSDYYRIFKNTSYPLIQCQNKINDDLTYKIYNKALLKGLDDDIPNSLKNKLENILSDCDQKTYDLNESAQSPSRNSHENFISQNQLIPECLIDKFENMKLKCLCK